MKHQVTFTKGAYVRLMRLKEKEAPEVSVPKYIKDVVEVYVRNREIQSQQIPTRMIKLGVNDGESRHG